MAMIRFSGLVAAMTLAHGVAFAQDGDYRDADNFDQAAGMMYMNLKMVELMSSECKRRIPETTTSIDAAREAWRHQDAREIEAAERRFHEKVELDPSGAAKFESAAASDLNEHVLPWLQSLPEKSVNQMCSQYFGELTSGVSRRRTPKAYRFLGEQK
jgi:hypothetical protein